MEKRPDIAIIGPGKVGRAIGVLAARAGYWIAAVGGRGRGRAQEAARQMGPQTPATTPAKAAAMGQLVLLTVPDEAIGSVCGELAAAGALAASAVVAHCSGALGSDVLAEARDKCGCAVGSMHPLQTFPTAAAAVQRFAGTTCFCEGDAPAVEALEALATAIGAAPVRIDPGAKPIYHAAAVLACNDVVALLDAALAAGRAAGIDPSAFTRAIGPMVRATVDNVLAMGPAAALTGPIARGDAETVRRHVAALADGKAELLDLYQAAGEWTVGLAQRKGTIDADAAARIREALRDPTTQTTPTQSKE